jgi:carbonic anhydrase
MSLENLFQNNKQWAQDVEAKSPGFFRRLLAQQTPQYLWIGCADSRVPANEIVGLLPGDLFVHRNVANIIAHSDLNCLSVVQFAIDMLEVKHVIVVGHYGCSGVAAAMDNVRIGVADNWLRHVQDVYKKHLSWLGTITDKIQRQRALCELNVLEQAINCAETTVVQDAWAKGQSVAVHGWVYGLGDGLLKDLEMSVSNLEEVQAAYVRSLHLIQARYTQTETT